MQVRQCGGVVQGWLPRACRQRAASQPSRPAARPGHANVLSGSAVVATRVATTRRSARRRALRTARRRRNPSDPRTSDERDHAGRGEPACRQRKVRVKEPTKKVRTAEAARPGLMPGRGMAEAQHDAAFPKSSSAPQCAGLRRPPLSQDVALTTAISGIAMGSATPEACPEDRFCSVRRFLGTHPLATEHDRWRAQVP